MNNYDFCNLIQLEKTHGSKIRNIKVKSNSCLNCTQYTMFNFLKKLIFKIFSLKNRKNNLIVLNMVLLP